MIPAFLISLEIGISVWYGIGIGMVAVGVAGALIVLVDRAIHQRRLRRMQRETMEARHRETEFVRRPKFLP